MVPLDWVGGVVGLIIATAISLYANALVAKLHEFGGKRHISYKRPCRVYLWSEGLFSYVGIAVCKSIHDKRWLCHLAGQTLKASYVLFRDDNAMKLPYFIAIAGVACGIFAICIPHFISFKDLAGFSTFFSLVYIVVAAVACWIFAICIPH